MAKVSQIVHIKLSFLCIVTGYLNACLIRLLPAVPGVCNTFSVTQTESNDLQTLTVPCSSYDLNGRNRGESYKVCFSTVVYSWHRTMTGENCMILTVGWATLFYRLHIRNRPFAGIGSLTSIYQDIPQVDRKKNPHVFYFGLNNTK